MPVENGNVQSASEFSINGGTGAQTSRPGKATSIPLTELLDKIPLAYSPITKQLHLLCPKPETSANEEVQSTKPKCESFDEVCKKIGDGSVNGVELSDAQITEDDMCDELAGGITSFPETEASSLSSEASHQPDESLVDDGGKHKKKGIGSFFSRSVFYWKSRESTNTPPSNTWKIFSKSVGANENNINGVGNEVTNDSDDHPVHPQVNVGSMSGNSKRYEDLVASSSALILHDRPSNLPAKSSDEEARHRQEYERMVDAAKKKERQEAKLRKKLLQQQIKLEERLANATKVWINEVLPKWETVKNCRKIRNLWWQGIPPCVRGRVWLLAIGNELNVTHQLYDICVSRAQELLRTVSSSSSSCDSLGEVDNPDRQASIELIQLDISRTFPQLCIFQQGGPYYDILHCLLGAYACYRPDIGYVQGMSFLAAVLILNMEEADAFICFANLLNRPCHISFFRLDQPMMQAYYTVFDQLMAENLPKIYNHFTSARLSPDLYLLDWIYTVFAKAMPLDVACRVWDVFLRDGEEFIFRTALGVLHLFQDQLLDFDFLGGAQFLTKLPDDLSADQLFCSIEAMHMQRYSELLSSARASTGFNSGTMKRSCALGSTANSSGTATPADPGETL